jgi:hypothetical protein
MVDLPPLPAASTTPADWLTSRVVSAPNWVTRTVGTGFDAYARIFHPLDDGPAAPRWADIAARNGRTMHPSARWENISSTGPCAANTPVNRGRGHPGEPVVGNMAKDALSALCALLAVHTSTAEDCWFAVWDGWGWQQDGPQPVVRATEGEDVAYPDRLAPRDWQLDLTGPKFSLPGRDYHLFSGPVQAATRIGQWVTADWFLPQSPSLFWPTDHQWCVATEIDFDTTLVGGTRELIEDIVGSREIEALTIQPDAPYMDEINIEA